MLHNEVISMKKLTAITICFILCIMTACTSSDTPQIESVRKYSTATFEYAEDTGFKLITSEIGSLHTFDGLPLKLTDEEFSGEWIYRIKFNPKSFMPESEEYIILFGETNVMINGMVYKAEDGFEYSDILRWAEFKYEYFDYEPMTEINTK